MTLQNTAEIES